MSGTTDGVDDRLSTSEFTELIQHLPVQEMFLIEYRTSSSKWRKLFCRNRNNVNQFTCELCAADASSFKNLLAHINGRKHVQQMKTVESLFHPEYTYAKDDEEKVAPAASEAEDNKKTVTKTTEEKKEVKVTAKEKNTSNTNKKQPSAKVITNTVKYPENSKKPESSKSTSAKPPVVVSSRKTEIVRNPIALNASNGSGDKKDEEEDDKPRYETDKIIIPTVHRNNSSSKKSNSKSPTKDIPSFCTKTYSSKPSDDEVRGILGVEYVIKMINKNKGSTPRYECGLCELVLDAFAMQKHLEGYNHRLKFCEKHFPTAIRHYRQYMNGIPEHEMFKVMTPVLTRLAVAIEKHHGRNLPYECYESDFTLHRHDILAKAYSCRHASEQYGPTFTHVIDAKEIDKYINERNQYTAPTYARSAIFDSKLGAELANGQNSVSSTPRDRHRNVVRENNKVLVGKETKPNINYSTRTTQFMPLNNTNYNEFSTAVVPRENENMMMGGSHMVSYPQLNVPMDPYPAVNNFIIPQNPMETFVSSSGYNYSMQESMPTNFVPPSYNNQPLQNDGGRSVTAAAAQANRVDEQTYNNMVDEFLRGTLKTSHTGGSSSSNRKRSPQSSSQTLGGPPPKRIQQEEVKNPNNDIHYNREKEISVLDAKFREYRIDPERYPHYNDEWQKFWKRRKDELIAAGKDHRIHNYQPEWVQFIKDHIESLYRQKLEDIKLKYQQIKNKQNSNNILINNTMADDNKLQNSKVDHTQVVSALRLMAALEENLGSLGPKIITLLSKALQLEKTNRTDMASCLLNNENCSVIETAKEKFKGQLLANMVEGSKQRAMRKAVEEAENLLSSTQQQQQREPKQTQNAAVTNNCEQQRTTIADILRVLRAHSDLKK